MKRFHVLPMMILTAAAGCAVDPSSSDSSGTTEQALSNTVSGRVTTSNGTPIVGATISIQGTGTASTTTDSNGNYAFQPLANVAHTVVASMSNCVFSPGSLQNQYPGAVDNFTGTGGGCTPNSGSSSSSSSGGSGTSGSGTVSVSLPPCLTPDATNDQEHAAAELAFEMMEGAAKVGGPVAPVYSNTILGSQRYRVQAGGTGIEFDPSDPLYPYVSNQMKAQLAMAQQQDATVAKFLSDGLNYAHSISNGWYFPSIGSISVLANFSYPGPTTAHIADNTSQNNSHQATVTGQTWCGTEMITIVDTVQETYSFSPLYSVEITNPGVNVGGGWLNAPPSTFKGSSNIPTTPFNGPSSHGNPHLVVSVNGTGTDWASYNFSPVSCWSNPSPYQCTGVIQIDPVPYAQPGAYYDATGTMVGTQANPFQLSPTVLYATSDHANQWATRTVSGVQQWGTFSQAFSVLGITAYKYVQQM